jgi:hypothetical protein
MPQVNWHDRYPFILVGGQAMDRGFTVEGLTITYMPRSIGQGNADTLQQRARFLGYKRNILGYCRVFLETTVARAFRAYVLHEEDVRQRLLALDNGSLLDWKRRFYLDAMFEPTRRTVLDLPIIRTPIGTDWFSPSLPYADPEATTFNQNLVTEFVQRLPQQHSTLYTQRAYYSLQLQNVFDQFLIEYKHSDPRDAERFASYLLRLRFILEREPQVECDLFLMRWGTASGRSVDQNGMKELFQGRNPKTGPMRYPGDRSICRDDRIALQLYQIDFYEGDIRGNNAVRIADAVPVVALRLSDNYAADGIEQPNNP